VRAWFNFFPLSRARWVASSKLFKIVFLRSSKIAVKLPPTKEITIAITAAKLIIFVSKILVLIPKPWPIGKIVIIN
jgi:hypothetical protein